MSLTKFNSGNSTNTPTKDSLKLENVPTDNINTFQAIIDDKYDLAYTNTANNDSVLKFLHKNVTTNYRNHSAHVNGYYYIQMVPGTWTSIYNNDDNNLGSIDSDFLESGYLSVFTKEHFSIFNKKFGGLATDIDIPQLNIEYESISGKNRSLNYASKINYAGDFSINYIETYDNLVFRYHEAWVKYIESLKKGYVNLKVDNDQLTSYSIDVSYFNAIWVVIYAPFTTNIRGLIKIMGATPINLPVKQVIGDRSKNEMTVINQNYKSNDMLIKFFDKDDDLYKSPFYKEFIEYMKVTIK